MKTFTEIERRYIEERIRAATGLPFNHPHPEFFLRPPTEFHQPVKGPKIAHMDNTGSTYPHLTLVWVHSTGDAIIMAELGMN